jgi:serine/threonine-protein kinase HipA
MAKHLWAHIYYQNTFVGILKEEPGYRMSFIYDTSYLSSNNPAIAHTLPLQEAAFISSAGLHPFFDNLVSEGWMEEAQTRLLGQRQVTRFELLMAFGRDCAGAVSVVDPESTELTQALLNLDDPMDMAVMTGRASLSGVQPKLALVEDKGVFFPAKIGELSTHIGKFPSQHHADLVLNEYLTMQAFKALLPDDSVADLSIGAVSGISQPALIIKRFDREEGGQRIHFEEFNQLLGRTSKAKYNGSYKEMADFLYTTPGTLKITEVYKLYRRILAGILLGNTDMHSKNFAMFNTSNGFRLTPSYDQVAAVLYEYKTMALKMTGSADMPIGSLKASNIIRLGEEFGLNSDMIEMACDGLKKNLEGAKEIIQRTSFGSKQLKKELIEFVEKRWNGTFALIGKSLSKKQ